MSDEIQQNRYDQIIRRVAGIIGPGSKVSEVITELFPMINVEDLPAELLRLGGTRLCFGGGSLAPVVAQFGVAQLFNPADSNTLITITRVDVSPAITTNIDWGVSFLERGVRTLTEAFRDTRDPFLSKPVGQLRDHTSAVGAIAQNKIVTTANTFFTLVDPNAVCVLAPGSGFEIGLGGSNNTFNYSFHWRERPAIPSELNV